VSHCSAATCHKYTHFCAGLVNVLREHTVVGVAAGKCVLQHESELYMFDMRTMVEDMAYQQVKLMPAANQLP